MLDTSHDLTTHKMADERETRKPDEEDVITASIGDFGRWQLLTSVLLSLVVFPCSFHLYIQNFISEGNATCAKPPGSTMNQEQWIQLSALDGKNDICTIRDLDYSFSYQNLSQDQTNATIPCSSWDYDTSHLGNTVVTEWNLVCDRAGLLNLSQMMFLMGTAIGGLICGYLSDRFGRKKILMVSLLAQFLLGVWISFTPWFIMFYILRSILGVFCSSIVYSALVLILEIVGGKWLVICGVSFMLPVSISYIVMPGIAFVTRDWRTLQLIISLSTILLLPLYWIVPESPRWLLALHRKEKALEILHRAAEFNGKPLPNNIDELLQQHIEKGKEEPPKVRAMDLFRTSNMRKITLVMGFVWFFECLLYYGLVLNLSTLGGDIYINSIISGLVEFPSVALSIILLLKLGRKWPLALAMVGAGAACLLSTVFHKDDLIHLVLIMVSRFLISSPNATIMIYTAELYPTVIRNLGLGSANLAAGISVMLTPYIWIMNGVDENLPIVAVGLSGVLGGLATLLLPETAGLTEYVEKKLKRLH